MFNAFGSLPDLTEIRGQIPIDGHRDGISAHRRTIADIIHGKDPRLLVTAGPCSARTIDEMLELAERIARLQDATKDAFFFVLRAHTEKPRTHVGWKGLSMQPDPCGTPNVKEGVRSVRQLFSMLTDARGIPLHDEALNIALAPYVNEWLSFTTIGARTSESQPHREHAASRDMPVGLKNSSDGELRTIIDAMTAVQTPQACIVENTWGMAWNHDAMGILRGGRHGSNFDEPSLRQLIADLARVRITFEDRSIPLPSQALGIDCAHGNSKVNGSASPAQQLVVGDAIVGLMEIDPSLQQNVRSLMYEVHLREGKQPIGPSMEHGVSTTDPCVGIDCFREHILPLADRYRRVMRPGA